MDQKRVLENHQKKGRPDPKEMKKIADKVGLEEKTVKTWFNNTNILKGRRSLFLVKWVGWGPEFNTWEPLANIGHCTEQLYQFYQSRLKEEEGEGPEEEYEVEQILDHRYCQESEYRVKWVGGDGERWRQEEVLPDSASERNRSEENEKVLSFNIRLEAVKKIC